MELIKTGIEQVDTILGGGISKGRVTVIGGRPAIGKSSIATEIAINIAKSGVDVLYCNLEKSEVTDLALDLAGKRFPTAYEHIDVYSPHPEDNDISILANEIFECAYVDVVILDYVQLIGGFGDNFFRLKWVCERLFPDKAFIWVSQLQRTVESNPTKRPKAINIRNKVGFFPDASLLLYRDSYYNGKEPDNMEILVCEDHTETAWITVPWTPAKYLEGFDKKYGIERKVGTV